MTVPNVSEISNNIREEDSHNTEPVNIESSNTLLSALSQIPPQNKEQQEDPANITTSAPEKEGKDAVEATAKVAVSIE